jgi:hypothetical protein
MLLQAKKIPDIYQQQRFSLVIAQFKRNSNFPASLYFAHAGK